MSKKAQLLSVEVKTGGKYFSGELLCLEWSDEQTTEVTLSDRAPSSVADAFFRAAEFITQCEESGDFERGEGEE